jgi:crotonobetainyl-CoA:carnitine CoA-transferase CaiB-like acyl-CoA transferase
MGSPSWGTDPRFATLADRRANWDALHGLMAAWSRGHDKQWIAETAQAAHVPSFPLREPAEHLESAQLRHRGFFQTETVAGRTVQVPGSPFGLRLVETQRQAALAEALASSPVMLGDGPPSTPSPAVTPGKKLPLSGIRVLDFSWVIAGPTATRYLAAMGAEVIKIEAPGRGDPGRTSELHSVLGQAKKAIVLDLKRPDAVGIAKALAARADVLVENFATGVMDRLGLGAEALAAINPRLIYVSASGLGRTGPESQAVAYGTLLQCYAGFAGLNRHPGVPPRVGMAWLDPMCGLMLAFVTAASVWRRRSGVVARVDFSMIEAMLWTMAEPLLEHVRATGGVYRCAGLDEWIGVDPRNDAEREALAAIVAPDALATWAGGRSALDAAAILAQAGVPAAALARSADLVADGHLRARRFWDELAGSVVPGLPWRASFGRAVGPAPGLGANTDAVLQDVLGLSPEEVLGLRRSRALG